MKSATTYWVLELIFRLSLLGSGIFVIFQLIEWVKAHTPAQYTTIAIILLLGLLVLCVLTWKVDDIVIELKKIREELEKGLKVYR